MVRFLVALVILASPKQDSTAVLANAGRSVYHGVGGCFVCHGMQLQGSPIAPPLDKEGKYQWIAAKDGTYTAIYDVITHGVPGTVMVSHPNGINDQMAKEVATYIWAVNNKKTSK